MARTAHARPRQRRNRTAADPYVSDILAMRARGMSYRSIASALAHFVGVDLSEDQVSLACGKHGEQPMASKARR